MLTETYHRIHLLQLNLIYLLHLLFSKRICTSFYLLSFLFIYFNFDRYDFTSVQGKIDVMNTSFLLCGSSLFNGTLLHFEKSPLLGNPTFHLVSIFFKLLSFICFYFILTGHIPT